VLRFGGENAGRGDQTLRLSLRHNPLVNSVDGEVRKGSHAQIEAFGDTWHWTDEAERAFDDIMQSGNSGFELGVQLVAAPRIVPPTPVANSLARP
jgi:hypothetical protein